MTGKEFLQQAYFARQEVDIKLEQIIRLQALATQATSIIKNTPAGTIGSGSKIETAIIAIENRITKLAEEITNLLKITEAVEKTISQVKNPTSKKILMYRYLCFFSWKQISLLTKTSLSNVLKIHADALKDFSSAE